MRPLAVRASRPRACAGSPSVTGLTPKRSHRSLPPAAGRGSLAGGKVVQGETVDLSGALRQALRELGDRGSEVRKPVVIVLTANEDPTLGGNLDSLKALVAASRTRVFAVAITVGSGRGYSFPVMTAQFLDQLAKDSGGRVFRGAWDLKSILAAARKP